MEIQSTFQTYQNKEKSEGLALGKIELKEEYSKEWNLSRLSDFVVLTMDGNLLRPTLYGVGGLNSAKVGSDKFFMLLKYSESHYSKDIMDKCGDKAPKTNKYLKGVWCIINDKGEELEEFEQFATSPYLVKNSPIYSIGGRYYNVVTKEYLGHPSKTIHSDNFIIFDNQYEKDERINGILKINKSDGKFTKII
jgi:hypothetical protein